MKVFQCQNCKHKVKLKEIPKDYKCPKCEYNKAYFVEIEKVSNPIYLLFLYSCTLMMLIISGYFTFSIIYHQSKAPNHKVKVGTLSMELVESKDTTIKLYNTLPMSDEKAKNLKPFLFKLNNNGTYPLIYSLTLENVPDEELNDVEEVFGKTRINNSKVKFSLTDTDTNNIIKQGFVSDLNNNVIISQRIDAAKIKTFALRLWIDKDVGNEDQNKFYAGRIVLKIHEIIE